MFKFTVTTTRPNKNAAFFPNTSTGGTYESLMTTAKAARPTSGPDGVIGYSRVESPDGLTLTTEWTFVSPAGKDALMEDFAARATANGMIPVANARATYNSSVGHSTTVTFGEVA
jgi:hypothetical protein